MECWHRQQQV